MDMKYICNNVIDGNKCGAIIETRIDIKDYEITGKQIKKPIKLTGDISVKMHYPTMRNFTESNDFGTSDEERHLWLVVKCIDKIYKGTELFEEFTQEELYEWVQELPLESAEEIGKFFETYPLIKKKITLVCPTCGRETSWELGALEDFFDSGILTRII